MDLRLDHLSTSLAQAARLPQADEAGQFGILYPKAAPLNHGK